MLQMNFKMKNHWILVALFCGAIHTYAQTENDTIQREDVVVSFSFNPSLSDVFKLKATPRSKQEFEKEKISYHINSKKIPSDFVPTTKQATYVSIDGPKPLNYKNYAYAAVGVYGNSEVEVMLRPTVINGYKYGVDVSSYSVQDGIDDERVDNGAWKSAINLFLAKNNKTYNWKTNIEYNRNRVHWYGLDKDILENVFKNQDVKQIYNSFTFSGDVIYEASKIKSLSPSVNFFSDDFDSSEIDVNMGAVLDTSMFGKDIETKVDLNYLDGSFKQEYNNKTTIDYSFLNVGITPSYIYKAKKFQLDIALGLFLNTNIEGSKSNFWILPNVKGSTSLIKDIITLHGGIRSNVDQNSYQAIAGDNPFVSPTLPILTTRTPVEFFVGLEGKLAKTISYNTEASYKKVKNKLLFVHNDNLNIVDQPFQLGNSFGVVYDDINVLSVQGTLEIEFSKVLKGGVLAVVNKYDTDQVKEAWNLPNVVVETYVNYTKNNWFGQLDVNIVNGKDDLVEGKSEKIDGFLDLNLKAGYRINKQWNAHVNIYNALNSDYESYTNYQVQEFQLVAGLSFKF